MNEKDLIARLLKSRTTMEKYRRFPGWQFKGGISDELAIVETEIAILRDLQVHHPDRHEHIGKIIAGWEEAKAKLRAKMH
jgi:hypothetical protein